ncbi:MAG: hypothetical protein ACREU7_00525 [Burkholderiales bacterium]
MKGAVLAILSLAGLMACGEPQQSVQYSGGRYAGKPDTPAWKSEQFGADRAQWEREIKTRNLKQSEYTRMKGAG